MNLMPETCECSDLHDPSRTNDFELAPLMDWNRLDASEHFVQFYESDASLVRSVSKFICAGLEAGERCIVIVTPEHRHTLEAALIAAGIDPATACERSDYIPLDAAATLSLFMSDGVPDRERFLETVGSIISLATQEGR